MKDKRARQKKKEKPSLASLSYEKEFMYKEQKEWEDPTIEEDEKDEEFEYE